MRARLISFHHPVVPYSYPLTSNSSSSKSEQIKKRRFLDADYKWMQHNDDEVISLISQNHDIDFHFNEPSKKLNDGLYPLVFLGVYVLTTFVPSFFDCLRDAQSLQCLMTSNSTGKTSHEIITQIGGMACAILSIVVFWQIYKLQKHNLENTASKALTQNFGVNLILGVIATIIWIGYLKVSSSEQYAAGFLREVTLDVFLIAFFTYNLFNQLCLKSRVEISREGNGWTKMLLFLIKNAYFFMTLALLLILITLQASKAVVSSETPESLSLPILVNFTDVVQTLTILCNQFYIASYFIDINYIYDGDFVLEEKRKIIEKKLDISML